MIIRFTIGTLNSIWTVNRLGLSSTRGFSEASLRTTRHFQLPFLSWFLAPKRTSGRVPEDRTPLFLLPKQAPSTSWLVHDSKQRAMFQRLDML